MVEFGKQDEQHNVVQPESTVRDMKESEILKESEAQVDEKDREIICSCVHTNRTCNGG